MKNCQDDRKQLVIKGKKEKLRKKSLSTLSCIGIKTSIKSVHWSLNNEVFGDFSAKIMGTG